MRKLLIIVLTFLSFNALASYSSAPASKGLYNLNFDSVPSSMAFEVMLFASDVEEMLPVSMKEAFKDQVTIDFAEAKEIADIDSIDGVVYGGVKKESLFQSKKNIKKIYLNEILLSQIVKAYRTGDYEAADRARKTLIHETTHLFDYKRALLGQELQFEEHCINGPKIRRRKMSGGDNNDWEWVPKDPVCRKFIKSKRSISESPLFLTLSGWNLQGIIFKTRRQINKNEERSPDPYEYTNPSEYLAVNMEFFLTDKEYQCRRPTLNKYFVDVFGSRPFESDECEMYTRVAESSSAFKGERPKLIDIDPKRIYQIHYLFASEGDQMMSKWGHAMFRLVMCRPGRPLGPKCLNDVAYDVVLSFRANVEDGSIDYAKGLSGGYDSQLFILTMKEVIDEYTKGEFRDLLSIPLNYSEEQKDYFIMSTLEQYWSYLGSYFFVTNNCATETMRMVRIANYENYSFQNKGVFTPLGLMEILEESGISDMSVFKNREAAIKKGYLFPGYDEKLDRSFKALKEALGLDYKDFKEYVADSKALERREHIATIVDSFEGKELRRYLAMMAQIEDFVFIAGEKAFLSEVMVYIGDKKNAPESSLEMIEEKVREYMAVQKMIALDSKIEGGYGIPVKSEIVEADPSQIEEKITVMQNISTQLKEWAEDNFPEMIFEVTANAENRQIIMDALLTTF